MTTVTLKEARKRLGELVRAAERGQPVVLTRRGKKVARLEPVGKGARQPLPSLADFRASITVRGKPLSETLIAARREARY